MLDKYKTFIGKSALDLDITQNIATMAVSDKLDFVVLVDGAFYEDIDDKIRLYLIVDDATIIREVKIA